MLELGVTRVVKITAEKLWPLLGSFSRLPEWFPQIDSFSSEGDTVGSKRNIRIATFDIVQNLLEQDNNRYQTVYQVSSGPGITAAEPQKSSRRANGSNPSRVAIPSNIDVMCRGDCTHSS